MEEQDGKNLQSLENGFNNMDVVGIELHEMYLALQRAGFDKKEALYIIGIVASSGAMAPYKDDHESEDPSGDEDFDQLT